MMFESGAYERLAAALVQAQRERGIKIVMIASAVAGEGKSATIVRLAATLSRSYGRRVLLIDADLRRPVLHTVFQISNTTGLNELLCGDGSAPAPTIVVGERLELLPAGRPSPEPLAVLTSTRMHDVLERASQDFDFVLLDTPPVALLPDCRLLAAMVDTVLVVVAAGETDYRMAARAVEALGRDRIAGIVLNKADDLLPAPVYGRYAYADSRH